MAALEAIWRKLKHKHILSYITTTHDTELITADKEKENEKLENKESKSTINDSETVMKPSKAKSKPGRKTGRRVRKKVAPAYMTRPSYIKDHQKKQAD